MALHIVGQHNVTFIHIQKTAGFSIKTWLIAAMGNSQAIEETGSPTITYMKENYNVQWSFAVVRNPWDLWVSAYFHTKKQLETNKSDDILYSEGLDECFLSMRNSQQQMISFEEFLMIVDADSKKEIMVDARISNSMSDYLRGGVDLVLRFENLNKEFSAVQEKFNSNIPLPYLNSSIHANYQSYYTPTTKNLIYKLFKEDIDRWGYTF
jgi:hypothetical protein